MNLIDYNKAVEALEKERQLLLNREQYGAENVLVHHALNVIAELPIIRQQEIVRCKDCRQNNQCSIQFKFAYTDNPEDWFCAYGKRRDEE